MKKVLLISFFSTSRPGGSFRPAPLAKYLPEFGWQPVVLTPALSEKLDGQLKVIETPYHDVLDFWKRLLRLNTDGSIRRQVKQRLGVTSPRSLLDSLFVLGEAVLSYPDSFRGWKPFAVKAGEQFLKSEHIDAMISCAPMTSHIIAKELKDKFKIPWIADFPDLWSQNHGYRYGPIRKMIDTRLELKTLSTADSLVTVSEPWADKLRALHKKKTVYVITHGFDPAEVNAPLARLTDKFTITYTGTIYAIWQDVSKLFAALRDLISDGAVNSADIEVRFYGSGLGWLDQEIAGYGLSTVVKQYGVLPKQMAVEKQRESQLLLLLDWDDPAEKGVHTYKIFEYLAARRPVLATGGSEGDVVAGLLSETGAGVHAKTVESIKSALKLMYTEFKSQGKAAYHGDESRITKYSHLEMARKFSEILDSLTRGK